MIDLLQLQQECTKFGIEVTQDQMEKLDRYASVLMEWNEKMNLTAIKKPEEIVTKHFVDSLTLLCALQIPEGAKLIDVGTGAGFPAVPVKVMRPDLRITLLDSLNKRVTFLSALSAELEQENLCIHARAEEAGQNPAYRQQYDVATARAVAHLRELAEYCLPLVKAQGVFAAMKSGEIETELAEAQKAIKLLGGFVEKIYRCTLPDGSARSIIVIRKISQTSSKYPRPHAKIAKSPLI